MHHQALPAQADQTHIAYTDGSSRGNPGPGGWAYFIEHPNGTETVAAGYLPDPRNTNNVAELLAAIHALDSIPPGTRIHIRTDSQYVAYGATQWLPKWKDNSWKSANKKPVKNKKLWLELDELLANREVTFEHIPGHAGIKGNEKADEMAQEAALLRSDFAPVTRPTHRPWEV
jgi:ribonuclease HI